LELTKQNALQNLIAQRGQPSFLANEQLARVIYGEHPYSRISATPESIAAMTRDDLINFHRRVMIPNNAVLVVGGDFKREEMHARIEKLFGAWQPGEAQLSEFPAPPRRTRRTLYLVDRPDSAQSNIVIANLALTRTDPDYFPLLVMHTILGANASSRVFMNLREDKGYTYGAYTNLDARRTAGTFRATAEVRTPVTGDSLKEFFYELGRIRDEVVSEKELDDARSYLTGIFPIRLETLDGLIDQLLQIKMFDLPDDYLHTYRERVSAVTRAEVQRVARRYITPDQTAIVIVGDAGALREQVAGYADEIEIYDNAGRRKEALAQKAETNMDGRDMSNTTETAPDSPAPGNWRSHRRSGRRRRRSSLTPQATTRCAARFVPLTAKRRSTPSPSTAKYSTPLSPLKFRACRFRPTSQAAAKAITSAARSKATCPCRRSCSQAENSVVLTADKEPRAKKSRPVCALTPDGNHRRIAQLLRVARTASHWVIAMLTDSDAHARATGCS
jgi:hypothetical protein